MTLPRSRYRYGSQTVTSDDGKFTLVHDALACTLSLRQGSQARWSSRQDCSPKQLAVAPDGTSVVLDAGDELTTRDRAGQTLSTASLLDVMCGATWRERLGLTGGTSVRWSTAGPSWEDFLAMGCALHRGRPVVVISGRGEPPVALEPESLSPLSATRDELSSMLRGRAAQALRAAVEGLRHEPALQHVHAEPWRLAAVGWARVAGETGARDAVPALMELAERPLQHEGTTSMGVSDKPKDPVQVHQFAADPLRQAARLGLIRLGVAPPSVPVLQVARRDGWLRTRWVTVPVPPDAASALETLQSGAMPSEVVSSAGPPTLVHPEDDHAVWSYDLFAPNGGRTVVVRWLATGGLVTHLAPVPAAALDGRVA